jgi:hypothetical protein
MVQRWCPSRSSSALPGETAGADLLMKHTLAIDTPKKT